MSNRFPLYPNDMTNEFGSANSLEARGGLFDSMEDEDVSEPSTAPETTDFPELPSDVAEHISQRTANNDVTQTVNQKKNKKSRSKVKAMMLLVPLAAALICAVVYLNTHYYGGIKKYQWVTMPLAIHGVVCKKDGTIVPICIGEDDNDPVFCISDILPHLAQKQMNL